VVAYSSNNHVGTPGAGNVISGNTHEGVVIDGQFGPANGNFVQGNLIGTQANGSSPLGMAGTAYGCANATGTSIGG